MEFFATGLECLQHTARLGIGDHNLAKGIAIYATQQIF
jgi:hypothetical protein